LRWRIVSRHRLRMKQTYTPHPPLPLHKMGRKTVILASDVSAYMAAVTGREPVAVDRDCFLSIDTVAGMLSVSRRTIYRLAKRL
jgi:hypothetical protein